MPSKDDIDKKFAKLLAEGDAALKRAGWTGRDYGEHHPSDMDYIRFRTEAANLISRVCGEASPHYKEILRYSEGEHTRLNSYYLKDCVAVLDAARRDFDEGMLFDLRALVAADLLGDFLEQAECLLENDYIVPAASLAGAILEDTLRKLCSANSLPVPPRTKIDTLNADLSRAGVYTKLVQKRITGLADIRNNADHGKFSEFKKEDVKDMVVWVRRFCTDQLG